MRISDGLRHHRSDDLAGRSGAPRAGAQSCHRRGVHTIERRRRRARLHRARRNGTAAVLASRASRRRARPDTDGAHSPRVAREQRAVLLFLTPAWAVGQTPGFCADRREPGRRHDLAGELDRSPMSGISFYVSGAVRPPLSERGAISSRSSAYAGLAKLLHAVIDLSAATPRSRPSAPWHRASFRGIAWSDHWSFEQFGFPPLRTTDGALPDPHYHRTTDTPDKVDTASLRGSRGDSKRSCARCEAGLADGAIAPAEMITPPCTSPGTGAPDRRRGS